MDHLADHGSVARRDCSSEAVQHLRPDRHADELHVLLAADLLVGFDAHISVCRKPALVPKPADPIAEDFPRAICI